MRRLLVLPIAALMGLFLVSCGDAETDSGSEGGGGGGGEASGTVCETTDAADDLLAEICEKGVLTVSTDPAYPPQSKYVPKEDKYVGFDIDVATEIANRLGVDDRLGDALVGRHHRRRLERPLGHERRAR